MEERPLELVDWTDRETVICECCGDPVFADRIVDFTFGRQHFRVDPGCAAVMNWAHRVCRCKDRGVEVPPAIWQSVMASVWERLDRRDPQRGDWDEGQEA